MRFADATPEAGIDFTYYDFTYYNGACGEYHYVETFGAGAAFLDYDRDGLLDH